MNLQKKNSHDENIEHIIDNEEDNISPKRNNSSDNTVGKFKPKIEIDSLLTSRLSKERTCIDRLKALKEKPYIKKEKEAIDEIDSIINLIKENDNKLLSLFDSRDKDVNHFLYTYSNLFFEKQKIEDMDELKTSRNNYRKVNYRVKDRRETKLDRFANEYYHLHAKTNDNVLYDIGKKPEKRSSLHTPKSFLLNMQNSNLNKNDIEDDELNLDDLNEINPHHKKDKTKSVKILSFKFDQESSSNIDNQNNNNNIKETSTDKLKRENRVKRSSLKNYTSGSFSKDKIRFSRINEAIGYNDKNIQYNSAIEHKKYRSAKSSPKSVYFKIKFNNELFEIINKNEIIKRTKSSTIAIINSENKSKYYKQMKTKKKNKLKLLNQQKTNDKDNNVTKFENIRDKNINNNPNSLMSLTKLDNQTYRPCLDLNNIINEEKRVRLNKLLLSTNSSDFDIFEVNDIAGDDLMYYVSDYIFNKENLLSSYNSSSKSINSNFENDSNLSQQNTDLIGKNTIDNEAFMNFISEIKGGYDRNKVFYHNDIHATDVLQTSYAILKLSNFESLKLDSLDILSLFIACLCHDYKHPGFTNTYLVNTSDDIALNYNGKLIKNNKYILLLT